jgi:hypothetical protein
MTQTKAVLEVRVAALRRRSEATRPPRDDLGF